MKNVIKIIKILVIVIIVLVVLLGVAGYFYFSNKMSKINHVEIAKENIIKNEGVEEKLTGYKTIALLGIDTRQDEYEGSRSDCIIIASLNQETKEVKLVSVYRDTYLNIEGYGLDKVNHSYAYGGPELVMNTLNQNLDLNIDQFITVNFLAIQDIVDKIGGVEIALTNAEAKQVPGISSAGTYNLSGAQALNYARIRKIDNDYARTERMRNVVIAVFEKAKGMNYSELDSLVNQILPEIYTNIESKEIFSYLTKISTYSIGESKGWPYEIRGITLVAWYGIPVTLEQNVIDLHKTLFNEENYEVSTKVSETSKKIVNKTGYSK